jgi:hypothetical protein
LEAANWVDSYFRFLFHTKLNDKLTIGLVRWIFDLNFISSRFAMKVSNIEYANSRKSVTEGGSKFLHRISGNKDILIM